MPNRKSQFLASALVLALSVGAFAEGDIDASDPTKISTYGGPGIKFTDFANGEALPACSPETVLLERQTSVFAAGGRKAAGARHEGRKETLVHRENDNHEAVHRRSRCPHRRSRCPHRRSPASLRDPTRRNSLSIWSRSCSKLASAAAGRRCTTMSTSGRSARPSQRRKISRVRLRKRCLTTEPPTLRVAVIPSLGLPAGLGYTCTVTRGEKCLEPSR